MGCMGKRGKIYTIKQLAELVGVSVRTLHHYDAIGLLKPSARTAADYRLYGESELLRLQQILFFKELSLPLEEIRAILDTPGFDQVAALHVHRQHVQQEMERLTRLLSTIDKTIHRLTEDDMTMTDEELYEGFTSEQRERYQREAREMYDPAMVAESERRLRKLSKAQWQAVKDEGDALTRALAALMDHDPGDPEVQAAIARHYAWVEQFYPVSADMYRGLGQLYTDHPEFRATYERYAPNMADFMRAAMEIYAARNLKD